ncbi:tribbles homolog 2-like [Littorina saxatilis]|uniref:Protein kinase domain-containing protein n=1 Tax=Littorina saxatilis TaxID=31220 RepID=A0AAN9AQW0_9CAEN
MSCMGNRPRLFISHGPKKKILPDPEPNLGNLSPDVQSDTLPSFARPESKTEDCLKVGKYVLFRESEKSDAYLAIDTTTQEELTCKVFPLNHYRDSLSPYWQVDGHDHIAAAQEIILGETKAYIFFPHSFGDLHSYVRQKKRLSEAEARGLFRQIVAAITHCHDNGVILRDLKLRKFVFQDAERTTLQLEGLEDAVVLSDDDLDVLKDKHGCPAYVSPEILSATESGYSGKSADVWSLGVMLYTMLVGRYPFHDSQPLALFGKIRRGHFHIPDSLSPKAQCLIRCLLRRDPNERLSAGEILSHPWFKSVPSLRRPANSQHSKFQVVPDVALPTPGPFDW